MSRVRDLLEALETASGVQTDAVESGSVPAPARVRLANFAPVSQTNAHGKAAFLFGLVFAAFGALPLLAALDVIHSPDSSFHAPRWFVGGVAALFFVLPGLSLVVHGLRGLVRERRRREMLAMHPDQPWRGDHPWHPDGETRSGWRAVRQRAVQIVAFSVFLAPFHWIGFREEGARMFLAFMALFDLLVVALVFSLGLLVIRAVRYGRTRLVYERFPVHPGEELAVRFEMSRGSPFERLSFRLLAVEDEYAGSGENASIVPWRLVELTRDLEGPEAQPDDWGGVRVTFDIPADAPGTKLGVRPPRYWALVVRGHAPGADYHERFLVPVYERWEPVRGDPFGTSMMVDGQPPRWNL